MTTGIRRLIWIAVSFLAISLASRIGLAIYSGGAYAVGDWTRFLAVGLVFDLTVLPWFLLPWAIYDAVTPTFSRRGRWHRWEHLWAAGWATLYLGLFIAVTAGEFAFWTEFGSRFDFIAVDYLVYTHEVIGNIRESYPVNLWIAGIIGAALLVTWLSWRRTAGPVRSRVLKRWGVAAGTAVWAALGVALVNVSLAETKLNAHVTQLSLNGIYALFHAYRHNELDYDRYYPVIAASDLNTQIRSLVRQPNAKFVHKTGIQREVKATGPLRKVNVILISVESLSAEFLGKFGNKMGLTPELDKLADKGLFFTRMYATGTRTVRGLEALSVGTPPTPGQSIVRRPNNQGLENLGEELKENGWKPYWIYGGYGFFDNMNAYFKANGYAIVDRSDMDDEGLPIHHETIWGIADEDLFTLAMVKLDREYARGNRFFAHIMTTSNHRPYTFPKNRIDLTRHRRESVVKYTDWAIGDFLRRASAKPWFDNTLFVIIADHTAKAAGKTDLPPPRYHIPMFWYAPHLLKPAVIDRLMSQIDVAPTLLGWLGINYSSRFFGYDIFNLQPGRERAFISTYQKLGYLKGNRLVVLDVNRDPVVTKGLAAMPPAAPALSDKQLVTEAISWYQAASDYFRSGKLKDSPDPEER